MTGACADSALPNYIACRWLCSQSVIKMLSMTYTPLLIVSHLINRKFHSVSLIVFPPLWQQNVFQRAFMSSTQNHFLQSQTGRQLLFTMWSLWITTQWSKSITQIQSSCDMLCLNIASCLSLHHLIIHCSPFCVVCVCYLYQQKAKSKSICNIKGCTEPVSKSAHPNKSYKQCDKHGFRGAYQKSPKPSSHPLAPKKEEKDSVRLYSMRIGHHTFKSTNATALLISLVSLFLDRDRSRAHVNCYVMLRS